MRSERWRQGRSDRRSACLQLRSRRACVRRRQDAVSDGPADRCGEEDLRGPRDVERPADRLCRRRSRGRSRPGCFFYGDAMGNPAFSRRLSRRCVSLQRIPAGSRPIVELSDFNFDRDSKRLEMFESMQPVNPDLRRFKAAGGNCSPTRDGRMPSRWCRARWITIRPWKESSERGRAPRNSFVCSSFRHESLRRRGRRIRGGLSELPGGMGGKGTGAGEIAQLACCGRRIPVRGRNFPLTRPASNFPGRSTRIRSRPNIWATAIRTMPQALGRPSREVCGGRVPNGCGRRFKAASGGLSATRPRSAAMVRPAAQKWYAARIPLRRRRQGRSEATRPPACCVPPPYRWPGLSTAAPAQGSRRSNRTGHGTNQPAHARLREILNPAECRHQVQIAIGAKNHSISAVRSRFGVE